MKKNLVIVVVLSMYIFLCGCPYEYTAPNPTSIFPATSLINEDALINAGTPASNVPFWSGTFNNGVSAYFKFMNVTPATGGTPIYTLVTQTDTTVNNQLLDTCYFTTVAVNGANYVIMETVVYSSSSNTNFNHMFAVITSGASGNLNILPLPASITNTMYTGKPLTPSQVVGVVQGYLNNIYGPKPVYPLNTDGGIDEDTEIKNMTVTNIIKEQLKAPTDTLSKHNVGNTNGHYHFPRPFKIALVIFAFIIGIVVGYFMSRRKKEIKK